MKRELKFRAWDGQRMTNSGIMFNTSKGTLEVPVQYSIQNAEIPEHLQMKIMQYSGLKDKNGKEIYEGDLMEAKEGMMQVYFIDGKYILMWADNGTHYCDLNEANRTFEVCGNIYQNKKLLKQKK